MFRESLSSSAFCEASPQLKDVAGAFSELVDTKSLETSG